MITVLQRPTIELVKLEVNYDNGVKAGPDVDYNVEQIGKYPYIYITGTLIESNSIAYLKLYNNTVVPYIEMEFTDKTCRLVDDYFPLDGALVSMFLNANNDNLMPIRMDFKIYEFYVIKGKETTDALSYKIKAYINVDDLLLLKFETHKGTSFDVLKKITKDTKLGFASNVQSTDDGMTWLNGGDYKINFMYDIVSHSYISDDTFLFGYIDFYYNFNYIDIETALQEDVSDQTIATDRNTMIKDGKEDTVPLILSNHPDKKMSGLFISKYTVDDKTTKINIDTTYNNVVSVYDKINFKYNDFLLDSISDSDSDNKIVLKSDGLLYDEQKRFNWNGKFDEDNVHKNYLYAEYSNNQNLLFLQKLKMTIQLNKPNFNLYRFQKVNVELFNLGKPDTTETKPDDPSKDNYENKIINKLSGEWLITSINYTFSNKEGNTQEITLIKRELTKKYEFKNGK